MPSIDEHGNGGFDKLETLGRTWQNGRNNSTCVLKLCTFLSRSLQNNNVKSPNFAWSENGKP